MLFRLAELDVLFNLAKLFALTALGFWFLSYFETLAWAVLIALLIPWVDAVSVWRGPTDYVVSEQPGIFEEVSIAFRIPGEPANASANLGPPDILFFALFLAAAERFGLRVAWTWLGMTGLLGATLVLTVTTDVAGLPALPAICFGFLLPNADLIWHALRRRGARAGARSTAGPTRRCTTCDADVIERSPEQIVLLTRERPPRNASVALAGGTLTLADAEPAGGARPTTWRTGSSWCRTTRARRSWITPSRATRRRRREGRAAGARAKLALDRCGLSRYRLTSVWRSLRASRGVRPSAVQRLPITGRVGSTREHGRPAA